MCVINYSVISNEKEADYIGLLLMASAAYDPREAPKVYEMLDNDNSSDKKFKFIHDLFSTHPSGKKRVAALSKPKVMEEAMTIFSKAVEATRYLRIHLSIYLGKLWSFRPSSVNKKTRFLTIFLSSFLKLLRNLQMHYYTRF